MFGLLAGATALTGFLGARSQSRAADRANQTQRDQFERTVELTEPRRQAGNLATEALLFQAGLGPAPVIGGRPANALRIQEVQGPSVSDWNGWSDRNGGIYTPSRTSFQVGDQMFDTREEAQAYIDSQPTEGGTAFSGIAMPDQPDLSVGAFEASPGYQFRLDEGMKALERGSAARGMRFGSPTMKNFLRFGQGLASDEFGAFANRQIGDYNRRYGAARDQINDLRAIAGMGESATSQQINAGGTMAANVSNNALRVGQSNANALTGTVNNLSGLAGLAQSGYFGQNPGFGITPIANPFGV